MFSVSAGALTSVGTFPLASGTKPIGIFVDPTNQWAFVAHYGSNTIGQYTINPDGQLTLLNAAAASTQGGPMQMIMRR
jgi:6-phosphogluconolactonase (cycloisomerase 2 family)